MIEQRPGWRSREGALTHPGDHSWEAWSEDLATQQLRQLSDIRRNAPGRGHRKKVVVITRAKGLEPVRLRMQRRIRGIIYPADTSAPERLFRVLPPRPSLKTDLCYAEVVVPPQVPVARIRPPCLLIEITISVDPQSRPPDPKGVARIGSGRVCLPGWLLPRK
jgi:hypothetical protein